MNCPHCQQGIDPVGTDHGGQRLWHCVSCGTLGRSPWFEGREGIEQDQTRIEPLQVPSRAREVEVLRNELHTLRKMRVKVGTANVEFPDAAPDPPDPIVINRAGPKAYCPTCCKPQPYYRSKNNQALDERTCAVCGSVEDHP